MGLRAVMMWAVVVAAVFVSVASGSSDDDAFAKAKEECGPQLAGLAPCLSYVGGSAKTPTMDCCTGLKQVLAASKKCVCLLVKYKDEPSLGVKFDVNRALGLPSICQSAAKLNQCPSVMMWAAVVAAVFVSVAKGSSDDDAFAKAKEECGPQLAGLAPCLSYVGGSAKTPTMDCCTGLKQVLAASKKCVCLLVKYKDEPSLGVKFDVNRALGLPSICQSAAKLNQCPSLLHLSPNSPEAKMFAEYDNSTTNGTTASTTAALPSTATATPANSTSSDAKAKGKFGTRTTVFYGLVLGFMLLLSL